MVIDRFAPSPTGLLHLGHAFSAWTGWQAARAAGGRFLLRMEDLDASRVRTEYHEAIIRDLHWLGIDWDGEVLCQSTRLPAYAAALEMLAQRGLTYACCCTRRDITGAISAPQELAPGPDGPIYPGTCRGSGHHLDAGHAIRLDMRRAIDALGGIEGLTALSFQELGKASNAETGSAG